MTSGKVSEREQKKQHDATMTPTNLSFYLLILFPILFSTSLNPSSPKKKGYFQEVRLSLEWMSSLTPSAAPITCTSETLWLCAFLCTNTETHVCTVCLVQLLNGISFIFCILKRNKTIMFCLQTNPQRIIIQKHQLNTSTRHFLSCFWNFESFSPSWEVTTDKYNTNVPPLSSSQCWWLKKQMENDVISSHWAEYLFVKFSVGGLSCLIHLTWSFQIWCEMRDGCLR